MFQSGAMHCHTLGSEAKKKSNKNKLVAVGRESREEPKVKSQLLVLLLIKFPAYIKSSLGS